MVNVNNLQLLVLIRRLRRYFLLLLNDFLNWSVLFLIGNLLVTQSYDNIFHVAH